MDGGMLTFSQLGFYAAFYIGLTCVHFEKNDWEEKIYIMTFNNGNLHFIFTHGVECNAK